MDNKKREEYMKIGKCTLYVNEYGSLDLYDGDKLVTRGVDEDHIESLDNDILVCGLYKMPEYAFKEADPDKPVHFFTYDTETNVFRRYREYKVFFSSYYKAPIVMSFERKLYFYDRSNGVGGNYLTHIYDINDDQVVFQRFPWSKVYIESIRETDHVDYPLEVGVDFKIHDADQEELDKFICKYLYKNIPDVPVENITLNPIAEYPEKVDVEKISDYEIKTRYKKSDSKDKAKPEEDDDDFNDIMEAPIPTDDPMSIEEMTKRIDAAIEKLEKMEKENDAEEDKREEERKDITRLLVFIGADMETGMDENISFLLFNIARLSKILSWRQRDRVTYTIPEDHHLMNILEMLEQKEGGKELKAALLFWNKEDEWPEDDILSGVIQRRTVPERFSLARENARSRKVIGVLSYEGGRIGRVKRLPAGFPSTRCTAVPYGEMDDEYRIYFDESDKAPGEEGDKYGYGREYSIYYDLVREKYCMEIDSFMSSEEAIKAFWEFQGKQMDVCILKQEGTGPKVEIDKAVECEILYDSKEEHFMPVKPAGMLCVGYAKVIDDGRMQVHKEYIDPESGEFDNIYKDDWGKEPDKNERLYRVLYSCIQRKTIIKSYEFSIGVINSILAGFNIREWVWCREGTLGN